MQALISSRDGSQLRGQRGNSGNSGEGATIDLALYIDVLRRHRLLVVSGVAVTLALAWLSYVQVSESGLAYRKSQIWSSEATLILSGSSQPEWRSELPPSVQPDRFTSLVDVYAELATGDAVMALLKRQGLGETEDTRPAPITATALHSTFNGAPTPLLKITAMATSPAGARSLATRATDAFISVLAARQAEAGIPDRARVELRIVKRSSVPTLTQPRSKTTFIIILLAGLIATVAAAFVRENARRPASRQPLAEPAFVVDRIQRAGEAGASVEAESMRAYEQSRTETNETDEESDQAVRRRWSAGSSG